jgi:hypothetical protein
VNRPETRFYFRGKPVEEMTRDELIEAVAILGKLYNDALLRNINHYTPAKPKAQEAAQ